MEAEDSVIELPNGIVHIRVKPNSAKRGIIGKDPAKNTIFIGIKAAPEHGKANVELLKLIGKVTKKKVRIISGFNKREKLIEIY